MKRIAFSCAIAACLSLPVIAQESGRAILVLDGSGSMWGQIDGKAKITIAQEVVSELLSSLPEQQDLGLTVYGHRRKGDCADIETIIAPSSGSRDAIIAAVNGVKPKGKTPMTDAVRQAAEALRYTEDKATVILVSDGIETCAPDPCAAARVLEEAGVDFTAHVVGFDVNDPEALTQMQCLADETGGTFRSASNAAELGAALAAIAEPEPEPEPVTVTFVATDGEYGPSIEDGLVWSLSSGEDEIVDGQTTGGMHHELTPGEYHVSVRRLMDDAFGEAVFGVGTVDKHVRIALPEFVADASIEAPYTAIAGSTLQVRWSGPDAENDHLAVGETEEKSYIHYTYTKHGSPLDLLMPPVSGNYELRYILSEGRKVLASHPIEITPVAATLVPSADAQAGATASIEWTGPDYTNDYIAIAEPDETSHIHYTYTKKGSPLLIDLPAEPGTYELRYVMSNKRTVVATETFEVADVSATLTPPAEMPAGATVKIEWTGPDNEGDFIAITDSGDEKGYLKYAYVKNGSPTELTLPAEPGEYDLVYKLSTARKVIARVPVAVTAVGAGVSPAAEMPAGATVKIEWTGPDNEGDFIAITDSGDEKGYLKYAYVKGGSPTELTLPAEPGEYDLVYKLSTDRKVIARVPVAVTAVSASVTPPAEMPMGATVKVEWTGPDNEGDFIAITETGDEKGYLKYAYVKNGSPTELTLPADPGEYDLVYKMSTDRKVIARVPVVLTEVIATLAAPSELTAGEKAPIEWTGPDNRGDFVAVAERDDEKGYIHYVYTKNGSPAELKMPDTPGDYDVVYVLSTDRKHITRLPVTVK